MCTRIKNINVKNKSTFCLKFLLQFSFVLSKFFLLFFVFCVEFSFAQNENGIIGNVTDTSATVLVLNKFLNDDKDFTVTLKEKNSITYPKYFFDSEGNLRIQLNNLIPNTIYECYVQFNDNMKSTIYNWFKTFPFQNDTTPFSFTLGSCTEQHHNDSIFLEMKKHQPLFFLHLGDWLYTNNFNERQFYYTESIAHQKELYEKRYEMPSLKQLLQTTPIDFVFDDEDGVFDDFSKHTYTTIQSTQNKTSIKEIPYPDSLRVMAIKGYHTFFPSYPTNPNQVYHSFVSGNAEFFFLDTRSTRSPNSESFQQKGNYFKYKVSKQHQLLDSAQLIWLLNGIKNSTAQWKFIVSGVTFNKSYKDILDLMLLKRVQNRKLYNNMNGAEIAASLASMWFAYPETQATVLNFCHENKIKNVIVLSGDAHTAAIDDGTNAGFPELMAGGLAQTNSKLVSLIYNTLHLNLWNKGGQGIHNSNYNDAFGKVEILGNDAVKLSCIDKYGKVICSYVLKDGFIPDTFKSRKNSKISLLDKLKAAKRALKIKRTL
ncbi:MAG: alkaline phosphatase D family protein [Bacteroidetes bacterium]|nr:alkaline phosphatase D family protein [Bacteroidota bacterium]